MMCVELSRTVNQRTIFFPEIDSYLAACKITNQTSDVEICWHVIIDLNVLCIVFFRSCSIIGNLVIGLMKLKIELVSDITSIKTFILLLDCKFE